LVAAEADSVTVTVFDPPVEFSPYHTSVSAVI